MDPMTMLGIASAGSGILSSIFGNKGGGDEFKQVDRLSRPQRGFLNQIYNKGTVENSPLYGSGSDFLQRLLSSDPEMMAQFEAPYMQNFEQNIVPGIAERFAGMGTGSGAGSSSALFNSLSQAGRSLQTDLAGLRGGMQMQGLGQALQYAQQPYSNKLAALNVSPFENVFMPRQPGAMDSVLSTLPTALLSMGSMFGGTGGSAGQVPSKTMPGNYGGFGRSPGSNTGKFGLPTFLGR